MKTDTKKRPQHNQLLGLLIPHQAAKNLNINAEAVRRSDRFGKLSSIRLGSLRRIQREGLEQLKEEGAA
jgi:excisionase family DNA binding protein